MSPARFGSGITIESSRCLGPIRAPRLAREWLQAATPRSCFAYCARRVRRYSGLRTGSARRARARRRQCFCLQRSIGRALHSKSVRSTARFGSWCLPLQGETPLRLQVLACSSLCRTSRFNGDISGWFFLLGSCLATPLGRVFSLSSGWAQL
ncbi:hypothetical protein NDU88_006663 [Pleurodeles waltl]|uniref:Uncharacterized protein n=1 Tax=Pleurodeles waltl TaxID=8319 RepID=A0AAV7QLV2_PLEWA|nr:hypothetical protein NDU88_006663 [Pleurodeles waltl]